MPILPILKELCPNAWHLKMLKHKAKLICCIKKNETFVLSFAYQPDTIHIYQVYKINKLQVHTCFDQKIICELCNMIGTEVSASLCAYRLE